METRPSGIASRSAQYLTFRVARLDFAVDSTLVRGILTASSMQPVAPSPSLRKFFGEWTCGFVSLRGQEIPVIDLRGRLSLPHATYGRHPSVVVVESGSTGEPRLAGFIADRLSEVVYARDPDLSDGKLRLGGKLRRVLNPSLLAAPAQ